MAWNKILYKINDSWIELGVTESEMNAKQNVASLESDVAAKGFTKNAGTITEILMNGASVGTSGAVDLGTVLTEHQDISGKQNIASLGTDVEALGFTKNLGTITGITMNGASMGTSGVVDLGTVITAHQDISGKQDVALVTSLSASSDDSHYPSAKAVYDFVREYASDFKGSVATKADLSTITGMSINDWAIVLADETQSGKTTRYGWNGSTWNLQWAVNNMSFTTAQMNSINSGITAEKVATYDGYATTIAGKLDKNEAITGATKCKITFDANGLVTAGADLTESDIPALSISKITDLQTSLDAKAALTKLSDGSVTKLGTGSIGAANHPIFWNNGAPQAISITQGSSTRPVFISGGVFTTCTYQLNNAAELTKILSTSTGITSDDSHVYTSLKVDGLLDDKVTKNATITAGTKCKITFDSKGLVTVGGDLTESDIPSLSISKITNLQTTLNAKQNISSLSTDVAALGFTKNAGTITGIKMNGSTKGTSGVVDLGTVLTSHQDISGKLDKNSTITAGTYPKITYDSKGLVTGGSALLASDIPDIAISQVTDLQTGLDAKQRTVLHGTEDPEDTLGEDGDVYLKYEE